MQIVVLGMHRSGTSALTKLLIDMGVYFGDPSISTGANPENPHGFWERRDLRKLNDLVLHSVNSDWNQISRFDLAAVPEPAKAAYHAGIASIIEELNQHQPWLIKEPRLCLLFPLLKPHLQNPICIHIYRHPLEVAHSLKTRNQIPIATGLALWESYNVSALRATTGHQRILVSHQALIENPEETSLSLAESLQAMGAVGIRPIRGADIDKAIKPQLYREQYRHVSPVEFLNGPQHSLYQAFERGEAFTYDLEKHRSVGCTYALTDYEELSGDLARMKSEAHSLENQIRGQKRELERQSRLLKEKAEQYEDSRIELKIKEGRISVLHNDLESLQQLFETASSATLALLNSRRWRFGDWLFSLPYHLSGRRRPPLADASIMSLSAKYSSWKLQYNLLKGQHLQDFKPSSSLPKPYVPIDDQLLQERISAYYAHTAPRKKVIYTAIVGNYDELKIPEDPDPEFDYVYFSDVEIKDCPIWQFRPITYFNADVTRIARYYKLHPHVYLQDYDVAVWVDANILIRKRITEMVDLFNEGGNPLGIFTHYSRTCTYDEARECQASQKDDPAIIDQQIMRLREEGFPEQLGLVETNMLISRPNCEKAQAVFTTWWRMLDNGSKRDQLSVMYALWKNDCWYTPIAPSKSRMARFDRERFELFNHQQRRTTSHPSRYQPPTFIRRSYQQEQLPFWRTDDFIAESRNRDVYEQISVDVVVPVHNAPDDTRNCLESVISCLPNNHRIIIIDDGSDAPTRDYLREFQSKHQRSVFLERNERASGYTKAANQGMKLATTSEYVILLNSDTIVTPGWSLKIIECAESNPDIGIVGPLSNAASWQSIPRIKDSDGSYSINPLPPSVGIEQVNQWCEKHALSIFPRVAVVNGFCFCIKRAVIDAIGYFDELSFPKGYNEENDYCFRATDAGFSLAIATHTYVFHAKSKSYTPETRLVLCEESRRVFEAKYGVERISRATESTRLHPLIERVRQGVCEELDNVL